MPGVEPVPALRLERVAPEQRERGRAVHLRGDAELLGEECLRGEHLLEDRARADEAGTVGAAVDVGRLAEPVQPRDDSLIDPVGFRGLGVVLVVERDVVEDVLALGPHPIDPVAHDRCELVGERWIVLAKVRHDRREEMRVPIVVLEAFAGQAGPPRSRAHHEAPAAGVGEGPCLVARALEAEHRIEDVERDHREAVAGVGRPGGLE